MGRPVRCYCGEVAILKDGQWGKWYSCPRYPACDGAVGCHPGTTKPLGAMADQRTRHARKRAHAAFDPLWKDGDLSRGEAYRWLANEMGRTEVHMGEMTVSECELVVGLVDARAPTVDDSEEATDD